MQITKEIFDEIAPGEVFRVVTTRVQNIFDPMVTKMTFVCVKGKSGTDWAIYGAWGPAHPDDIARHGDKIHGEDNIRNICPCEDEVFHLYRP